MAETADLLFWFAARPEEQYIVPARSMDEAKQKMADRKLNYDRCGCVGGPHDGMPPGEWKHIDDVT